MKSCLTFFLSFFRLGCGGGRSGRTLRVTIFLRIPSGLPPRSQPRLTHAVPQTAQSHMTSPSLSAESSACQELGHKHTPTNVEPGTHMEYAAWPHSPRRNLRLHHFRPATDQRSQPRLTHTVPQTAQSHMTSPSLSAESSACQENVRSGLDTDTHPQTWNLELTWNMQPGLILHVGTCGFITSGLQQTNAPSQDSLTQCHKRLSLT